MAKLMVQNDWRQQGWYMWHIPYYGSSASKDPHPDFGGCSHAESFRPIVNEMQGSSQMCEEGSLISDALNETFASALAAGAVSAEVEAPPT